MELDAPLLGLVIGASCQPEENVRPTDGVASCGGEYFEPQECTPVCRRKTGGKRKSRAAALCVEMAAPSGMDHRTWEFAVIDEREKLDKMADGLPYAKMLKGAPMAIVVCADERKSSYWYLDCSVAAQNILLAAEALELEFRMDCNLPV